MTQASSSTKRVVPAAIEMEISTSTEQRPRKRQKGASPTLSACDDGKQLQLSEKKTAALLVAVDDNKLGRSISNYLTDDSLVAHIFSFVGPRGTAKCMSACRSWDATSKIHPSLWRNFVADDFGFEVSNQKHLEPTAKVGATNCNAAIATSRATPPIHWHNVYRYLTRHYERHKRADITTSLTGRVVFADDGGSYPGYPAADALSPSNALVWCTSHGVDRNVDLVVELEETSIVTGFAIANGGFGYSAPLKEGLVFVSMDPPDLELARSYNDDSGSAWVQKLALKADMEEDSHNHASPTPLNPKAPVPVVAISFPSLTQAIGATSMVRLDKPIVGRYIHFKMLSSHLQPGLEIISDNIDLMHFHTEGAPVGDLDLLVPSIAPPKPVPEYARQHPLRSSRIMAMEDGEGGPWFYVHVEEE